ncbi:MAG: hypothetical protein F6K42_13115 [Leptolyngbya sp. SIO1D8]|nr:hypothetical protein [Leptolyngbya sp. SIO1D8]
MGFVPCAPDRKCDRIFWYRNAIAPNSSSFGKDLYGGQNLNGPSIVVIEV